MDRELEYERAYVRLVNKEYRKPTREELIKIEDTFIRRMNYEQVNSFFGNEADRIALKGNKKGVIKKYGGFKSNDSTANALYAVRVNITGIALNEKADGKFSPYADATANLKRLCYCIEQIRDIKALHESRTGFEWFSNHKVYAAEAASIKALTKDLRYFGIDEAYAKRLVKNENMTPDINQIDMEKIPDDHSVGFFRYLALGIKKLGHIFSAPIRAIKKLSYLAAERKIEDRNKAAIHHELYNDTDEHIKYRADNEYVSMTKDYTEISKAQDAYNDLDEKEVENVSSERQNIVVREASNIEDKKNMNKAEVNKENEPRKEL